MSSSIDRERAKRSSYLYDLVDFTNEGANQIGDNVYKHMKTDLRTE